MSGTTNTAAEWTARLEPVAAEAGVELVQAEVHGELLRIYIDRPTGVGMDPDAGVGLDECERVSRALSAAYPELGDYVLEVSSPGLDRPLVKPADFERFAGRRVRLRTRREIGGSRNFVGILQGGGERGVRLLPGSGASEVAVAWDDLEQARLAPQWARPERPGKKKQ